MRRRAGSGRERGARLHRRRGHDEGPRARAPLSARSRAGVRARWLVCVRYGGTSVLSAALPLEWRMTMHLGKWGRQRIHAAARALLGAALLAPLAGTADAREISASSGRAVLLGTGYDV